VSARLRSGQVAAAAGVNVETLRYYERRGLLPEPERTLGGHRSYPEDVVTVLRVVKAAQRLGFTLDEVAELLAVGGSRHGQHRPHDPPAASGRSRRRASGPGLRERAAAKLVEVEARIADLAVIASTLRATLDARCDDLMTCAATDCCPIPFSTIAQQGDPGADDR
jgi:MerR family transcriptional regulator, mercuric resistance operon regulatory protein